MDRVSFDPDMEESWYFGGISMKDSIELLMAERGSGVFLVRDSFSLPGNFLLCVRENFNVCHYMIHKVRRERCSDGVMMLRYRIQNSFFDDLPSLLVYFMSHELGSGPLVRPPTIRKLETVTAIYNFRSGDPEDLPFKNGEILKIIGKPEKNWWMARNSLGCVGSIPATYVRPLEEKEEEVTSDGIRGPRTTLRPFSSNLTKVDNYGPKQNSWFQPNKVLYARVTKGRAPSVYDEISLRIQIGDLIRLTRIHIGGLWEGERISPRRKSKKKGYFPFTCVELLDYTPVAAMTKHKRHASIYGFAALSPPIK